MDEQKLKDLNLQTIATKKRDYQVKGAPKIGFYFTCPMQVTGYEFPIALGHAFRELNRSSYEKNMHALEFYMPAISNIEYAKNAELVSEICKNSGVVFIVKNSIEQAKQYNAEGVIFDIDQIDKIDQARKDFGDDFIIGVDCKSCAESAKNIINNDQVDYVSFEYSGEDSFKLVEYWKANSDKPCAVKGYINEEICEQLVHEGADFIGCGDYIWNRKDKIADAVKAIYSKVELVISGKSVQ
jgi:thiamine monophosphate synthase